MTTTERLAFVLLALLPLLNGLCGLAAFNLTLTYWQRHRTTKILFYALAFWVLTVVFLLSGIERNSVELATKGILRTARSAAFFLFCFLALIGQVFDWIELLTFMRNKREEEARLDARKQGNADVSAASRALVLAAETSIIAAEQAKRAVIAVEKEHTQTAVEPVKG